MTENLLWEKGNICLIRRVALVREFGFRLACEAAAEPQGVFPASKAGASCTSANSAVWPFNQRLNFSVKAKAHLVAQ